MLALSEKIQSIKIKESVFSYLLCALFLIACIKVKIFLPFSPIPVSMMSFSAILVGLMFPFRVALITFMVFLVEGFYGSPIVGQMLTAGPSFGYYVGMIVAIAFSAKVKRSWPKLPILICSTLLIWSFGIFHLQTLVGLKKAFFIGVVPFVVGDLLKITLAYSLIRFTHSQKEA